MKSANQKIIPPEILLNGYRQGIFPMSEGRDDDTVGWYSASKRGVIPMNSFKVSSNVQRFIRQGKFHFKVNQDFRSVIEACADRSTTWISDLIINSFEVLHLAGHAHSVEVYGYNNNLIGGLYGVSLGAAFFGESMFKEENEADKIALWYCHQILQKNGFELWDTQFYTDHLSQFGCIEISAKKYDTLLKRALNKECQFVD